MNIKLFNKKVQGMSLKRHEAKDKKKPKIKIKITNEIFNNIKDETIFRARFNVTVLAENTAEVEVIYDFDFKSDGKVDDEFTKSLSVRSDAPHLAFPYIKTYIESVLQLSGYGNVNLPYFDFVEEPADID